MKISEVESTTTLPIELVEPIPRPHDTRSSSAASIHPRRSSLVVASNCRRNLKRGMRVTTSSVKSLPTSGHQFSNRRPVARVPFQRSFRSSLSSALWLSRATERDAAPRSGLLDMRR